MDPNVTTMIRCNNYHNSYDPCHLDDMFVALCPKTITTNQLHSYNAMQIFKETFRSVNAKNPSRIEDMIAMEDDFYWNPIHWLHL